MTPPRDPDPQLNSEEEQFIDRLKMHYTAPPMTPARRVGFDEALGTRLERRRRRGVLAPAFATLAIALMATWLILSRGLTSDETHIVVAETLVTDEWEYDLLYTAELAVPDERDDSPLLPDEYLAIGSFFIEG